jgi:CRP-like cAMP-binding protein
MEEVYYKKGDKIIEQDDIGDSFFVLEEGFVSVTVSFAPLSLSCCYESHLQYIVCREKQTRRTRLSIPGSWLGWERILSSVRFRC